MICNKCGNAVDHDAYFCDNCGSRVRQEAVAVDTSKLRGMALWEENPIFGTLGALLGSGAGIMIFYQWYMIFGTQFLAPVPGFLLGALTAGAYWWLGKRVGRIGLAISMVLMLLSGWMSNQIFWALVVYTNGIGEVRGFWEVLWNMGTYFETGYLDEVSWVLGLLSIYFGGIVGVAVLAAVCKTVTKD